jgi:hypothetical protein
LEEGFKSMAARNNWSHKFAQLVLVLICLWCADGREVGARRRLADVHKHLKRLNKKPVKSIEVS